MVICDRFKNGSCTKDYCECSIPHNPVYPCGASLHRCNEKQTECGYLRNNDKTMFQICIPTE